MRVLAVGASLPTLSTSYALRTLGFSVTIAEQLSQINYTKKMARLVPRTTLMANSASGGQVSRKETITNANKINTPMLSKAALLQDYSSRNHLKKHALANLSTFKTLKEFRLQADDRILKVPFSEGAPHSLASYKKDGDLILGGALEFTPTIGEILHSKITAFDSSLNVTSIDGDYLTYRLFHLLKHLDQKCFQFSSQFVNYTSLGKNQGVEVEFAGGSKEIYDLIVCGDELINQFRGILQQNLNVEPLRKSIGGIVQNRKIMRRSDALFESYKASDSSFTIQRLSSDLFKWNAVWTPGVNDPPSYFTQETGDAPTNKQHLLKQIASEVASNFTHASYIVDGTDSSLLFEDDFVAPSFTPRKENSSMIHPLITTGLSSLGSQYNDPLVDIRPALALENAYLLQKYLSKPHADLFKDVIVPYEKHMAHTQHNMYQGVNTIHTMLNSSSILDKFSTYMFRMAWRKHIKLFEQNAEQN